MRLSELADLLAQSGVQADSRKVATALLQLAHQRNWPRDTVDFRQWLSEVAMELAWSSEARNQSVDPQRLSSTPRRASPPSNHGDPTLDSWQECWAQ